MMDSGNELWLSSISLWEVLLLFGRGAIGVRGDPDAWIDSALAQTPIQEAPVTFDIARTSRKLHLSHQDPADQFILATAKVMGLTLVTADHRIIKSGEVPVLRARR